MHIGNLRTALYAYLFARANDGTFILRIEDTDRSRYVADAVDFIRRTLDAAGIVPDEGPDDIGGDYGPYVQSERMEIYKKYAEQLVATGHAYRCFCNHTEEVPPAEGEKSFGGYPRTCRELSPEEIQAHLDRGDAYVIRQKMPLVGETTFYDVLHGNVTIPNAELEDQVLLKRDGMPTYNFANVIDDHLMKVSHIIRGTEFITSTPKHVLLYEAFGWEAPVFVHLAPVMGRDEFFRHAATAAGLEPDKTVVERVAEPTGLSSLFGAKRAWGTSLPLSALGEKAVASASMCSHTAPIAYAGDLSGVCGNS